jgi:hypothetical protein
MRASEASSHVPIVYLLLVKLNLFTSITMLMRLHVSGRAKHKTNTGDALAVGCELGILRERLEMRNMGDLILFFSYLPTCVYM